MEFQTKAGELANAVRRVSLVVDRKSTMPMLLLLKIEAFDTAVKINGSSLVMSAGARVQATVTAKGAAAVDQQRLLDIVSKLPADKKVTCKLSEDQKLTVKSGSSRYELASMPAEDFPVTPKPDAKQHVEISSTLLTSLFEATEISMLQDDQRAHLSGISFSWGGKHATMVATDGMRLSRYTKKFEAAYEGSVFIPFRAVVAIRKFCESLQSNSTISLATSGAYLHFWNAVAGFACKLIDVKPTDYDKAIPDAAKLSCGFTATRESLVDALSRLRVAFKDASSEGARFFCDKANGRVEITSNNDECSGREAIKAEVKGEGEMVIDVNRVLDFLRVCGAEQVSCRFADKTPTIWAPAKAGSGLLGLIMPIV